jgi:DNA-directed RNA polymerase specialized sigma24 family protein
MAVREDAESTLLDAWDRLEPSQQILLLLRAEGHDLSEIARITNIDKPALSCRLHRARSRLASYLKQAASAEAERTVPEKQR